MILSLRNNKIIKNYIVTNSNIYFFLLFIIGLPIALLIKEFNNFFFPRVNFNELIILRVLLVFFTISIFLVNKKKINFLFLGLLSINIIYLITQNFGNNLEFEKNFFEFVRKIGISIDKEIYSSNDLKESSTSFFLDKNKNLLINFFNITLPLIILSCIEFKLDKKIFKTYLINIVNKSFLFLLIILLIKLFYVKEIHVLSKFLFVDSSFFLKTNPHLISFILAYTVILNIFEKKHEIKNKNIIRVIFAFFFLILISENLHLILTLSTIFTFFLVTKNVHKYKIYLFLFLILITTFLIFNFGNLDYKIPGSILNSLYIRFEIINLFLNNSINFNFLFGNNIFIQNIYTYPHNIFVDIYICTGFVGLFIFIFFLYRIFFIKIKQVFKQNFINILFFYNFLFSLFSGFFFNNITLNILFAAILIFSIEKEETIE